MPLSINIDDQFKKADDMIDAVFGEPVRLVPMLEASYAEGQPDPGRLIKETVGVFMTQDEMTGAAGDAQTTTKVRVDYALSIQTPYVEGFKKGDQVHFLKPSRLGLKCEINYIPPGDTGRVEVHLLRIRTV